MTPDDTLDDAPLAPRRGLAGALHRHRRLLGLAGLLWFGLLVGGGIFLSQLDARLGLHVFGPQAWVAGEPAVLRVGLLDLQFHNFQPLGPVQVRFLTAEGDATDSQTIDAPAGTFVQGAVQLPARAGGYTVELTTESEKGPLIAQLGATLAPPGPAPALPPPPKGRTPPVDDRGPLKLDLSPTDHVMAGGLPSLLTVRATDAAGGPVQAPITLAMKEGKAQNPLPAQVHTDHHGLATFGIEPLHPRFWFDLTAGDSAAARQVRHTPTQFVLAVGAPLVAPGTALPFRVQSLHREGPVFVDLWHGDRWLATTAVNLDEHVAEGRLTIPEVGADPALVWVQAYKAAYLPQEARGGRHLIVTRGDPAAAARWLAGRLADLGLDAEYMRHQATHADADPTLLRYLLGRTERPSRDPALVADSGATAKQTVNVMKSTWQRRFVMALLASGVLLFAVLGGLVLYNYRDVQKRWHDAGGDEEGEAGNRKRVLLDAGYIFAILAAFLLAMVQLMLSIRW